MGRPRGSNGRTDFTCIPGKFPQYLIDHLTRVHGEGGSKVLGEMSSVVHFLSSVLSLTRLRKDSLAGTSDSLT